MSSPSVAEILQSHVTLEVEGIDRMYLNVYIPRLQSPEGVAWYLRHQRGAVCPSSVLLQPISAAFVQKMEAFADAHQISVITFRKGERKDDRAQEALAVFRQAGGAEGLLFVGKAQEKTPVIRTEKRHNPRTGRPYAWLVRSTAMVNHWYWYGVDRDFGPFFLKVGTYFPYTVKVCLNGHEYLKQQLTQAGIAFRGPRQRAPLLRRSPVRAAHLHSVVGGEDRGLRPQVAALPPIAVHPGGYARRFSPCDLRPPGGVLADARYWIARRRAATSSRK